MRVSEAVQSRKTCRAFLDTPVPGATIRAIVDAARQAPSGGNLQPWRVWAVAGEPLARLKAEVLGAIAAGRFDAGADYAIYPEPLKPPYDARRFENGETVFGALGVARDDHAGRWTQTQRNFEFFGAPAALFLGIDRSMGPGQWADLGMFAQTVMLLAREHGLHTAPLESWAFWPKTVAAFVAMPPEVMLFCGLGLGHMDETHPVNRMRVGRAPLDEIATFIGC